MTLSALQRSSLTLGASLGYSGTICTQQEQILVSYSQALVKFRAVENSFAQDYHIPVGKEDQVVTACATHPTESLAAVGLSGSSSGSELQLVSTTTGQVVVAMRVKREISGLQWSSDGVALLVAVRNPGILIVLTYEQGQLLFQKQLGDFLPRDVPFVPRYMAADPNGRGFCVEIGLRAFYLSVQLDQNPVRAPGDSKYINKVQLLFIEELQGAQAVCFAGYKKLRYLVGGFADSRVAFALIDECHEPGKTIPFPYDLRFDGLDKDLDLLGQKQPTATFQDVLCLKEPPLSFSFTNSLFIPQLTPREAPQPKFGVSSLFSQGQDISVALKGGMIARLQFVSRLKTFQKKDEFEDSEEAVVAIQPDDVEDLPKIELVQTLNLNLDAIINQQIGANSTKTTLDFVATVQEEASQWGDARSQIEAMQLASYGGNRYVFILYDPITLQVAPCCCQTAWEIPYSILHPVQPVARTYVSVFNLLYYQQVPSLESLLKQASEQRQLLLSRAQDGAKQTSLGASRGLSLLQIASGQLGAAQSQSQQSNSLLAGHVPAGINTAQNKALLLRSYSSGIQKNRVCVGTREGLLLLFDLEEGLLSQAKLIDAVLSMDLNEQGNEIAIGCTDTVRIFVQNGRFLNQIAEIPVKMTQLLLYQSHALIACANAKVAKIDRTTHKLVQLIDGHNAAVTGIAVCAGKYDPAQYYVTADSKGMLLLWESSKEKSLVQFNAREPVYAVRHLTTTPGQLPTVVAAVGGKLIGVDFHRSIQIFKATLVSEGRHIPIRDVVPLDEARFVLGDFAGGVWSVIMPNDLTGQFTVTGKSFGRAAGMQLVQEGYLDRVSFKDASEIGALQLDAPLGFKYSPEWIFIAGTQPGSQSTLLRLEQTIVAGATSEGQDGKKVKTITVDLQHFQKLVRIRAELESRQVQVQLDYEHQIRTVQQNNRAQLELQKNLSEKEVKAQQEQCKSFSQWAEKEAEVQEQKLQELDRQNSEQLQKIEADFRSKSSLIQEQQQILERQMQEMLQDHVQALQELQKRHDQTLQEMEQDKDRELAVQQKQLQEQYKLLDKERQEFTEMLQTAEEDGDVQLQEQNAREKKELEKKQQQIQVYAAEAGMIRNKFDAISKQTLAFMSNLSSCENAILQQRNALAQLQAQRQDTEREKQVRRQQITQSEERIYDLKQQAKELEKYRFVLDFKIKDLQKLIQPREQEIHDLQEQTREVGQQLEEFHRLIGQVSDQISESRLEQIRLKESLEQQKTSHQLTAQSYKQLQCDVAQIVQIHGSLTYVQLRDQTQKLSKYGGKPQIDAEQKQADEEKTRHKQFLFQAAKQLTQQLASGKEDVVQENQRIVEENTELLKEAAVLRREIQKIVHAPVSQNNTESQKVFQMRITAQEAEIRRLQKRLRDLEEMQDE